MVFGQGIPSSFFLSSFDLLNPHFSVYEGVVLSCLYNLGSCGSCEGPWTVSIYTLVEGSSNFGKLYICTISIIEKR